MAKDHFLSQFYIKKFGFLDKNNKNQINIYALNLKNGNIKKRTSGSIFYRENLFYSDIEKKFSNFEGILSKVIYQIEENIIRIESGEDKINLNKIDFSTLGKFFDFQIRRSKSVFTKNDIIDNGNQLMKSLGTLEFVDDFSIVELRKILDVKLYDFFIKYYNEKFFSDNNLIIDTILNRGMTILYTGSKSKRKFISGDFPMHAVNGNGTNGLKDPNTELILPLTSKILLISHGNKSEINYVHIKDLSKIRYINQLILSSCHEFIIGDNKKLLNRIFNGNKNTIRGFLKSLDYKKANEELFINIKEFLKVNGKLKT